MAINNASKPKKNGYLRYVEGKLRIDNNTVSGSTGPTGPAGEPGPQGATGNGLDYFSFSVDVENEAIITSPASEVGSSLVFAGGINEKISSQAGIAIDGYNNGNINIRAGKTTIIDGSPAVLVPTNPDYTQTVQEGHVLNLEIHQISDGRGIAAGINVVFTGTENSLESYLSAIESAIASANIKWGLYVSNNNGNIEISTEIGSQWEIAVLSTSDTDVLSVLGYQLPPGDLSVNNGTESTPTILTPTNPNYSQTVQQNHSLNLELEQAPAVDGDAVSISSVNVMFDGTENSAESYLTAIENAIAIVGLYVSNNNGNIELSTDNGSQWTIRVLATSDADVLSALGYQLPPGAGNLIVNNGVDTIVNKGGNVILQYGGFGSMVRTDFKTLNSGIVFADDEGQPFINSFSYPYNNGNQLINQTISGDQIGTSDKSSNSAIMSGAPGKDLVITSINETGNNELVPGPKSLDSSLMDGTFNDRTDAILNDNRLSPSVRITSAFGTVGGDTIVSSGLGRFGGTVTISGGDGLFPVTNNMEYATVNGTNENNSIDAIRNFDPFTTPFPSPITNSLPRNTGGKILISGGKGVAVGDGQTTDQMQTQFNGTNDSGNILVKAGDSIIYSPVPPVLLPSVIPTYQGVAGDLVINLDGTDYTFTFDGSEQGVTGLYDKIDSVVKNTKTPLIFRLNEENQIKILGAGSYDSAGNSMLIVSELSTPAVLESFGFVVGQRSSGREAITASGGLAFFNGAGSNTGIYDYSSNGEMQGGGRELTPITMGSLAQQSSAIVGGGTSAGAGAGAGLANRYLPNAGSVTIACAPEAGDPGIGPSLESSNATYSLPLSGPGTLEIIFKRAFNNSMAMMETATIAFDGSETTFAEMFDKILNGITDASTNFTAKLLPDPDGDVIRIYSISAGENVTLTISNQSTDEVLACLGFIKGQISRGVNARLVTPGSINIVVPPSLPRLVEAQVNATNAQTGQTYQDTQNAQTYQGAVESQAQAFDGAVNISSQKVNFVPTLIQADNKTDLVNTRGDFGGLGIRHSTIKYAPDDEFHYSSTVASSGDIFIQAGNVISIENVNIDSNTEFSNSLGDRGGVIGFVRGTPGNITISAGVKNIDGYGSAISFKSNGVNVATIDIDGISLNLENLSPTRPNHVASKLYVDDSFTLPKMAYNTLGVTANSVVMQSKDIVSINSIDGYADFAIADSVTPPDVIGVAIDIAEDGTVAYAGIVDVNALEGTYSRGSRVYLDTNYGGMVRPDAPNSGWIVKIGVVHTSTVINPGETGTVRIVLNPGEAVAQNN